MTSVSTSRTRREYHTWSVPEEIHFLNILVDILKEPNARNNDGKIKSETWNATIAKFNAESGQKLERKHVDSRSKIWKALLKSYTKIAQQSGWGGNFINGIFDVDQEVWQDFIKV
jgi:hypothetical protein